METAEGNRSRLLIVEDERIIAGDLEHRLSELGYTVLGIAGNGDEALDLIGRLRPDLVICDINLGDGIDGITVAAEARRRWDVPALFLTAHYNEELARRAALVHSYGYILKPYREQELAATLEIACHKLGAEREVREHEWRLFQTLNSIGDAVITTDEAGCIRFMNPMAEALCGCWMDAARGQPIAGVLTLTDGAGGPFDPFGEAERGPRPPTEALLANRRDEPRMIEYTSSLVGPRSNPLGVVVVFRDQTERMKLEQERRLVEERFYKTQKMEAISRLGGGIAHTFNNLLTEILGAAELSLRDASPALRGRLQRIKESAQRGSSIISNLLLIGRRGDGEARPVSVQMTLQQVLAVVRETLPPEVLLEQEIVTELPAVRGSASQLYQLFLNLILNAREALLEKRRANESGELLLRVEARAETTGGRSGIIVKISDSGVGMDEETVNHAFEPFYSARIEDSAAGLGLSVAYAITTAHHGELAIESRRGRGTTAEVYLPACDSESTQSMTEQGTEPTITSQLILLVEDEPMVADVTRDMLEDMGYRVATANGGHEGIERFKELHGTVALVITDLTMPDLSGLDVVREIRNQDPATPILCTSGYSDRFAELKELSCHHFLAKPYTAAQLAQKVEDALAPCASCE